MIMPDCVDYIHTLPCPYIVLPDLLMLLRLLVLLSSYQSVLDIRELGDHVIMQIR